MNSEPIVLKLQYQATDNVLNLLNIQGQQMLHDCHLRIQHKMKTKHGYPNSKNFDPTALQMVFERTSMSAIIAAFQEGKSVQQTIHQHDYINPHIPEFKGIRYGDHVEVCFKSPFIIEKLNILSLQYQEIVTNDTIKYWKNLFLALTNVLPENNLKKMLMDKYDSGGIG